MLSGYRQQDGLGYYESNRDAVRHFFLDRLPRGTHVFENSLRIQLKRSYQGGVAGVECMYVPGFNSHSDSVLLEVG